MTGAIKILVIDDEEVIASKLCWLITRRVPQVECETANNHADGLRMALAGKYALTLLDLRIPVSATDPTIDVDLVVQSIPKFPRPVIVVTEMQDPEGILQDYCFAYQAENFFPKHRLIKTIDIWDAEMGARQLISSLGAAYLRSVMPSQQHLFAGGVGHLYPGGHYVGATDHG